MSEIKMGKGSILFRCKDEQILIEPYGPDCLRCRMTRNATFSDESWTLLPPRNTTVTVTGTESCARITNGKITAEIDAFGRDWANMSLRYFRNDKCILERRSEGDYNNDFVHVEGDHYRARALFEARDGEHFYGLGQERVDAFDRKGGTSELLHYNTKSTVPYVYSSLGYGFLWNNPAAGRCETTRNHTLWQADSTYQIDYLIFAGDSPSEVMQTYCELTGYAPAFPRWAAGFWQCRMRYETQEQLLEAAREYKRREIPISVIVADFFHWPEQGEWKFDSRYWPDPAAMVRELDSMGIRLFVSIWPTINPRSENWKYMTDRNMVVRTENGQYGTFEFHGQQTFVDFTNPETREYVWDRVKENYYANGVRGFWLDEGEPEVHPQQMEHLHFYLGNGAQTALAYPFYYAKTFYDGLKAAGETEIVTLNRAAFLGSQRNAAVVWNGDTPSNWKSLRQSVASGLSMAMCGIPWWTTDIGGFYGADIESDDFRELIVRWFQFGLFCPVMRLHGARNRTPDQASSIPGLLEPTGGANEIWAFGDRDYPILKALIEQRERLCPYLMRCTEENSRTGAPIMRPMFFDYPEDEHCYTLENQYFFGPDILFAPITQAGQTERDVYLPAGEWVDVNTGCTVTGAQTVQGRADLAHFIAFVRKDSEVLTAFPTPVNE